MKTLEFLIPQRPSSKLHTQFDIYHSLKHVIDNSQYIGLNHRAITVYCKTFKPIQASHWSKIYPLGYQKQPNDNDELDFLFLIGSQAFCFWGYPNKWTIAYQNQQLDGWWALIACFQRALAKGTPILDGQYLAQLSLRQIKQLYEGTPEIPLLNQRHKLLRSIGRILVQKYQNRFHHWYDQQQQEAYHLINALAKDFPGFDDQAMYQGKPVYFYKKAQIVITDIAEMFQHQGLGEIANLGLLPGHADYKIPMVLRQLGILNYSQALANKVDQRRTLLPGSTMEVEIRANMLWATKLICDQLRTQYPTINPGVLGGIMWNQSQLKSISDKPYHLTKTLYY